jgi:DNA polymerase-3 subunit beta
MTDDTLAPEDNPDTVEIEQPGDDAPAPEPSPEVNDAADKPKAKGRAKKDLPDSPGNDGKPRVIAFVAKQLKAALAGIGEVVERRNTIPILSNVMISAEHGKATLIATDLDMECVRILDVEQAADALPFRTTVAERLLSDIVKKIDGDATITLTLEPGKVVATAGRARFTLPTLPVEDFPVMTDAAFDHVFELAAFDLAAMIDGVRFAMCTEETRYYLNGIYLHATESRGVVTGSSGVDGEGVVMVLRAVATDGHRLARYDLPQPDGAGALNGVIVPRKAIGVLDKVLDGFEGPVEVAINAGKARFDLGDMVLTTKLVDGTFPDYTRVIPSGNDKVLLVDPKTLAAAAGRVMVMADGKTRAVKVALDRDMVTLSCQSAELGDAREEAPGDYDSEALTIGFNGTFLTELLGRIQGDTMRVELADPAAPTLFRDANDDARGLYVLMPMRV